MVLKRGRGRPPKNPKKVEKTIEKPEKPEPADDEDFIWKKVHKLRTNPGTPKPEDSFIQVLVTWTDEWDDSWLAINNFPVAELAFRRLMKTKFTNEPEFYTDPIRAEFLRLGLVIKANGTVTITPKLRRERQRDLRRLAAEERAEAKKEAATPRRVAVAPARNPRLAKTRAQRKLVMPEEPETIETPALTPPPPEPTPAAVVVPEPQVALSPPTVAPIENPYALARQTQAQVPAQTTQYKYQDAPAAHSYAGPSDPQPSYQPAQSQYQAPYLQPTQTQYQVPYYQPPQYSSYELPQQYYQAPQAQYYYQQPCTVGRDSFYGYGTTYAPPQQQNFGWPINYYPAQQARNPINEALADAPYLWN